MDSGVWRLLPPILEKPAFGDTKEIEVCSRRVTLFRPLCTAVGWGICCPSKKQYSEGIGYSWAPNTPCRVSPNLVTLDRMLICETQACLVEALPHQSA